MFATSHRRWFQFSIRTVLLLMTVVAIGFGVWVSKFHRRHQALSALRPLAIGLPRRIRFDVPSRASWLRRQRWLAKLVGEDFFDEPVEITLTAAPGRNGRVNDDDLRSLGELPTLRRLSLDFTAAGDAGMPYLRSLGNLEQLNLASSRAGDAGLENISGLSRLERLDLSGTLVTDAGLRHLSALARLKVLNLAGTNVTDEGVEWLKNLDQLVSLDFRRTQVQGGAFGEFPALKHLDLSGTGLTDVGLRSLPSSPFLQRLKLNDTAITDEGLKRVRRFKALEELELRGTKITGKALSYLQTLPRLRYLNLCDTQIGDADIEALNEICSLASVSLLGTGVGEAGLTKLQVAGSIASEPMDQRTVSCLAEPTELDFASQPLCDVIDYVKDRHGMEIQLDAVVFADRNKETSPVTCSLKNVSLLRALEELLAPMNLVLVYRQNVTQIMGRPVRPALRVPQLADGEVLSPRLVAVLAQNVELDFADQPFSDVIDDLAGRHKVEIRIDAEAFRRARGPSDVPISRSIKGIPLRSALGLLLEPLDMVCVAEGDTLIIRPASVAQSGPAQNR